MRTSFSHVLYFYRNCHHSGKLIFFFPDLRKYLKYFILIVLSGCLHIICGFWPSSPSHLAGKKHSILSKTRLRAHYCLGISRLLLRWLLKYNFSVIIEEEWYNDFKDKNLTFDNMLCLFSARWAEGWRPKTTIDM